MEDSQFFDSPPPRKPKRSKKWFVILVFFLILLGVGAAAAKYLTNSSSMGGTKITPTPTDYIFPTDTPSAKATPSPSVSPTGASKSTVSIEVENGSGVAGVAGKMATFLKNQGYTVSGTSNADNFTYQNVTIEVKKSEPNVLSELKSSISTGYTLGTASASLPTSSSNDAIVIVGK